MIAPCRFCGNTTHAPLQGAPVGYTTTCRSCGAQLIHIPEEHDDGHNFWVSAEELARCRAGQVEGLLPLLPQLRKHAWWPKPMAWADFLLALQPDPHIWTKALEGVHDTALEDFRVGLRAAIREGAAPEAPTAPLPLALQASAVPAGAEQMPIVYARLIGDRLYIATGGHWGQPDGGLYAWSPGTAPREVSSGSEQVRPLVHGLFCERYAKRHILRYVDAQAVDSVWKEGTGRDPNIRASPAGSAIALRWDHRISGRAQTPMPEDADNEIRNLQGDVLAHWQGAGLVLWTDEGLFSTDEWDEGRRYALTLRDPSTFRVLARSAAPPPDHIYDLLTTTTGICTRADSQRARETVWQRSGPLLTGTERDRTRHPLDNGYRTCVVPGGFCWSGQGDVTYAPQDGTSGWSQEGTHVWTGSRRTFVLSSYTTPATYQVVDAFTGQRSAPLCLADDPSHLSAVATDDGGVFVVADSAFSHVRPTDTDPSWSPLPFACRVASKEGFGARAVLASIRDPRHLLVMHREHGVEGQVLDAVLAQSEGLGPIFLAERGWCALGHGLPWPEITSIGCSRPRRPTR